MSVQPLRVALLGLLVLLLSGCRVDLVTPIELTPDGGAVLGLSARFDARMLAELDALGVDPTAELGAAVAADPRWELQRTRDDDGALTVAVVRTVRAAGEVGAVYRELVAGLAGDDPALELDVEVERLAGGGQRVAGTARFRPPVTSGLEVDGSTVGDDEAALAELVAEHATAAVELRFPAPVEAHDGVRLDRRTVRFDLEPGVARTFTAEAGPPSWWARLGLDLTTTLVVLGSLVVLVGIGLLLAGRRRVSPEV
ncbi:MAG: hypothetical protein ACNA8R_05575 [Nitriliruptoraceae bacterium]